MHQLKIKNYITYLLLGLFFAVYSINISSNDEIDETESDENISSESKGEMGASSSLRKCLMKAKSTKERKECEKVNMPTVEKFIEDEELSLLEGFLKGFNSFS